MREPDGYDLDELGAPVVGELAKVVSTGILPGHYLDGRAELRVFVSAETETGELVVLVLDALDVAAIAAMAAAIASGQLDRGRPDA